MTATESGRGAHLSLAVLLAALFLTILNETTVAVALPLIAADLDVPLSQAQWLTTSFVLTMAVVVPLNAWMQARWQVRTLFVVAMLLFVAGSAVAATGTHLGVMLMGRVLQGAATAMLAPTVLTIGMQIAPPDRRGRVMGVIAMVGSVAPAAGPAIGGLMVAAGGWHAVFLGMIPVALIITLLGVWHIPSSPPESVLARWDALSTGLSVGGFGLSVFGLSSITSGATSRPMAVLSLGIGMAAVAAFCRRQLRLARGSGALLDLRVFQRREFSLGAVGLALAFGQLFGTLNAVPLVLQGEFGTGPGTTGLLLLPGGLTMFLLAPVVGRWFDRHGPRRLTMTGAVCSGVGVLGLALVPSSAPAAVIMAPHAFVNMGAAFCLPAFSTFALSSLHRSQYAHGSAVLQTLQHLSGALGAAVILSTFEASANASRTVWWCVLAAAAALLAIGSRAARTPVPTPDVVQATS